MKYKPHHVAISVRNLDESLKFYEALGYKQVHRRDEDDGTESNVHLKLGDSFLEMFFYKENESKPKVNYGYANNLREVGVKHIAHGVDDVDAALSDLKAKGFADDTTKIHEELKDVRFFFIKDPDGVWVEVIKDDRYS